MVRILFLAALAIALVGPPRRTWAASAWTTGQHSAARLLDGGAAGGERLAGVEIRLDRSFITYWRSPGAAGVPPNFDFTGSQNVKDATVDYPAPRLIDEDGTEAYGYSGGVTFPVRVALVDPKAPAKLDLALDYAVCSRICLPVKARMTLDLAAGAEAGAIREALALVPVSARLGEGGAMRIDAVTWTGPTTLAVVAQAVPGATLFVEAPEPWYFSATPGRVGAGGRMDFTLRGPDHRPEGPLPADPMRLTLVVPGDAIEVAVPLDAAAPKP